ncbi:MAG: carbohydate-binding domain-containing protein [Acidobacteriota bacterium]
MTLVNQGEVALRNSGWKLYFNFARIVEPGSVSDSIELTHIDGDFYRIRPSGRFAPLEPDFNESLLLGR